MNPKQRLLKALSGLGFDDKNPTIETVKTFLTEQEIDPKDVIDGATGKAFDLDAVFAAEAETEVEPEPDANTRKQLVVPSGDEPGDLNSLRRDVISLRKQLVSATRGTHAGKLHIDETPSRKHSPEAWARNQAKKAYDVKARSNLTAFSDSDSAETCAAVCRLAIFGNQDYPQKALDKDICTKAQVAYSNTAGGFLVPQEFVAQLLYMTEPFDVARRIANVKRMTRDVVEFPRKTGIQSMSFVSETGTLTESNAAYDRVTLTAKKAGCLVSASTELLEDSAINVADDIASGIREAYGNKIDDCYFIGDSTNTYGGMTGLIGALPASAYMNATGAWSAFVLGDFHLAMGRVENVNSARCAFVCSRQFFHQVMQRLDKAASMFKNVVGPAISGADASFLGFPVFFSQRMATATGGTGTKSVYFGDFVGATMIGERRDLTIASSEHSAFTSDQIQFRATARFDVNIHGDGKGSTYGPITCLLTA